MKNKALFLTAALGLMTFGSLQAQEQAIPQALKSYNFVEIQGGAQMTATDANIIRLCYPGAAVSFGRYFSPVVGARLHVAGGWGKSGWSKPSASYYRWNYVTPDLDVLVNLTNLVCKSKDGSHPLNLILLGGLGLTYSWDKDGHDARYNNPVALRAMKWDDNHLGHNIRAGLRVETNVTKPLGLSIELSANSTDDKFNSKFNNSDDWQFYGMMGLSYRFNHKYRPLYIKKIIEVFDTVDVEETIMEKVKEKRPLTSRARQSIDKTIFFKQANATDADKAKGINEAIKEIGDLLKQSDDAVVTLTGYADKGTGSSKKNLELSKKRAKDVADILTKEYGIDASRLKVDAKGDTEQPFANNDDNRCVTVKGEGTFVITNYEEVEVEKPKKVMVRKPIVRTQEILEPNYD